MCERLDRHVRLILRFYDGVVDDERGGFHNQLRDDGTVYDRSTKHVVGTCRFIVNYATAARLYGETDAELAAQSLERCRRGIQFLRRAHWDGVHGGMWWVVNAEEGGEMRPRDRRKFAYAAAFGIMAAAKAVEAGAGAEADALLRELLAHTEEHFYEAAAGLYRDMWDEAFGECLAYRGANANMHMCEALMAAYDATGEKPLLERALLVAHRLCVDLAPAPGRILEHYTADWRPDPSKNKDCRDRTSDEHIFRPHGYQPGHGCEWAKLLMLLDRRTAWNAYGWLFPTAGALLREAWDVGWDAAKGGLCYTYAEDGAILDGNRYYVRE